MTLFLVTGYRGHGKDTLYKQLADDRHWPPYNWIVYVPELMVGKESPFTDIRPIRRLAFADVLKQEVKTKLISDKLIDHHFDHESYKDIPIILPAESKDQSVNKLGSPRKSVEQVTNKTFRDYCIERAEYVRETDPDYWARQVIDQVNQPGNVMITDWRYPNELCYYFNLQNITKKRVHTIRLFRSQIPIPNDDIMSEHSNDDVLTDYLLVTSTDDFHKAVEQFPQYKLYRPL